MVANVEWGVTAAIVQALIPQYTHNSANYPVDTTYFPTLVTMASTVVNSHVIDAEFTLTDFSTDTTSVPYLRCQAWTARLTAAYSLRASVGADNELADTLEKGVLDELAQLKANPGLLGGGGDDIPTADTWTTVQGLGLDTTDDALETRDSWREIKQSGNDTIIKKVNW